MTWLAIWLIAVGAMDLLRGARPRLLAPVAGALVLVAVTLVSGLTGAADLVVLTLSIAPLTAWWWASERAQGRRGRDHVVALGALAGGGALLVALSGWAGRPGGVLGRWIGWADLPLVERGGPDVVASALLVLGLMLTNLATANIIVRLVLVATGAIRPGAAAGTQPADRLRGGRLLGPMERLLILGLGLAGHLTAAGLVIAAKGLIRFPELQSRAQDGSGVDGVGIDEMTEYFLIGSFVSWLTALGALALTR